MDRSPLESAVPPSPPSIQRRISLTPLQRLILPWLFLVPILALFGVFGERESTIRRRGLRVEVSVEYPDRLRYGQREALTIAVRNVTSVVLDSVHVSVDPDYLHAFIIERAPDEISNMHGGTSFRLRPGERRVLSLAVAGRAYWRTRGEVRVVARTDTIDVPLSTFVFP